MHKVENLIFIHTPNTLPQKKRKKLRSTQPTVCRVERAPLQFQEPLLYDISILPQQCLIVLLAIF